MFQALRTIATLVLIAFAVAVPETDQVVPEATESFFESMSKDVKAVQLASAPSLLQAAASPSMLLQAPAPAPVHSEESFFESMSKDVKAVQLASASSLLQADSPSMLLQAPAPAPVHSEDVKAVEFGISATMRPIPSHWHRRRRRSGGR